MPRAYPSPLNKLRTQQQMQKIEEDEEQKCLLQEKKGAATTVVPDSKRRVTAGKVRFLLPRALPDTARQNCFSSGRPDTLKEVPGYREGLNVYQTFTCPRTDSAWTSASLRMNCNVEGDQPFNHYYCIPNAERTHFVEFCYDRASLKTEIGNCWEFGGIGYLNQVDCTNFVKGCPDFTYLSERVYKIRVRRESLKHEKYIGADFVK
uniref:Uncharacterized protein n=1 Tax=Magallana gigas TaxID=29159 RepID=K1PK69_MAGGI